jgi:hypothetical protein
VTSPCAFGYDHTDTDTAPVPDVATSTRSTATAGGVNPAYAAWTPYTATSWRYAPVVVTYPGSPTSRHLTLAVHNVLRYVRMGVAVVS